jgi:hypothetical protein
MSRNPEQNREAAHARWDRVIDRVAATKPARDAFHERFNRDVDPDGVLPEAERQAKAEQARRYWYQQLGHRSAAIRAAQREHGEDAA